MDDRFWRVGQHYGIHIYAVAGTGNPDDDVPVATAMTRELAAQIVEEHNVKLP